jgi:hypothetical protein
MNAVRGAGRIHSHVHSIRRRACALLAALELFVGLGALYGGYNPLVT